MELIKSKCPKNMNEDEFNEMINNTRSKKEFETLSDELETKNIKYLLILEALSYDCVFTNGEQLTKSKASDEDVEDPCLEYNEKEYDLIIHVFDDEC